MEPTADDLLSFKEFPPVHGVQGTNPPTAQISINSPQKTFVGGDHRTGIATSAAAVTATESNKDPLQELINDMSASVHALGGGAADGEENSSNQRQSSSDMNETDGKSTYSFWSIEYYQQFFNVDTVIVLNRIASSMIPKRAPVNYLKSHIDLNPDLYGPFWITITLIFSIAISGNVANYLQNASEDFPWKYNFHLVSYAATAIFIYACFVPATIWAILKWSTKPVADDLENESVTYTPGILSLMCIYGYSLAIYIPVSILWVIQVSILQWLLVITAALLSGSVLIFILTPSLRNSKYSLFLVIGILGAHFLLAAGFMLYFFHVPTVDEHIKAVTESIKNVVANNVDNVSKKVEKILTEKTINAG